MLAVELCCEDIRGGWLISWSSKYSYSGWKSATLRQGSRGSTGSETVESSGTGISRGLFGLFLGLAEESRSSLPLSWCLAVTDNGDDSNNA